MPESTRSLILASIDDSIANLLYYGRKEDEDLPEGRIEEAIEAGEITIADMAERYWNELHKGLGIDPVPPFPGKTP